MVTSEAMQSYDRVDEDQVNYWHQNFGCHFQRLNEFVEFFFQLWNFLQQQPYFEGPEGKEISADLMWLGVDANK